MQIEKFIEILEKFIKRDSEMCIERGYGVIMRNDEAHALQALLSAYEKEKEKNKELNNKRQDLINMSCKASKDVADALWQDKIKAKIEEVSNGIYDAKIVLQSLLEEKENSNGK